MYKDKWPQLILSAENMEYTGKAYNRASITKNEITNITGAAAGAISYEGRMVRYILRAKRLQQM
mgnify:CR=1 FL=1